MTSPAQFTAHSIMGLSKVSVDPKDQDVILNKVTIDIMRIRIERTELVRNHHANIMANINMDNKT